MSLMIMNMQNGYDKTLENMLKLSVKIISVKNADSYAHPYQNYFPTFHNMII